MRIAVIIPTLDEAVELPGAIASVQAADPSGAAEIIVADGGSRDGTVELVRPPARLVAAPRGRARQVNAAARTTAADVLLVLHADCRLPPAALDAVTAALRHPRVVGGAFHKRFRSTAWLLRGVRARTWTWHRFGAVLGDQAVFVRRDAFETLGGFRPDAIAEDLDFSWRLRRLGRVVLLKEEVLASARRLEQAGIVLTWARWWAVVARQVARGLARVPSVREADDAAARADGDRPLG